MLKHLAHRAVELGKNQPPSGGCVLKLQGGSINFCYGVPAAFGRLCVETMNFNEQDGFTVQPPSGGCVLKQQGINPAKDRAEPAAFGRLCVETINHKVTDFLQNPAAFGRLCVETGNGAAYVADNKPAAFGRLCVETSPDYFKLANFKASRLRAAVC